MCRIRQCGYMSSVGGPEPALCLYQCLCQWKSKHLSLWFFNIISGRLRSIQSTCVDKSCCKDTKSEHLFMTFQQLWPIIGQSTCTAVVYMCEQIRHHTVAK